MRASFRAAMQRLIRARQAIDDEIAFQAELDEQLDVLDAMHADMTRQVQSWLNEVLP